MLRLRLFLLPLMLLFTTAIYGAEISYGEYQDRPIAEIRFEGSKDVAEDVLCNELNFGEGKMESVL